MMKYCIPYAKRKNSIQGAKPGEDALKFGFSYDFWKIWNM